MFVPFRTTRTVIQRLLALNTAVTPIDIVGDMNLSPVTMWNNGILRLIYKIIYVQFR